MRHNKNEFSLNQNLYNRRELFVFFTFFSRKLRTNVVTRNFLKEGISKTRVFNWMCMKLHISKKKHYNSIASFSSLTDFHFNQPERVLIERPAFVGKPCRHDESTISGLVPFKDGTTFLIVLGALHRCIFVHDYVVGFFPSDIRNGCFWKTIENSVFTNT